MRDDLDLSIANLRNVDVVAEVVGTAFDLDAVVQELLERRQVKDLVADGLAAVDGVLYKTEQISAVPNTMRVECLRYIPSL